MTFFALLALALTAVLGENLVLGKVLGVTPFLEGPHRGRRSLLLGGTVTILMTLTASAAWLADAHVLVPLGLEYLRTPAFVLALAGVALTGSFLLRKLAPALREKAGPLLPLAAGNCALLGVCLLNVQAGRDLLASLLFALFSGVGYTLVLLLFNSVRDRLRFAESPKAFEGLPLALVSAGLLALAFLGFSGLTL